MPVTTCRTRRTVAALPKTYHQLALLAGVGMRGGFGERLDRPRRLLEPVVRMAMARCFMLAMR